MTLVSGRVSLIEAHLAIIEAHRPLILLKFYISQDLSRINSKGCKDIWTTPTFPKRMKLLPGGIRFQNTDQTGVTCGQGCYLFKSHPNSLN